MIITGEERQTSRPDIDSRTSYSQPPPYETSGSVRERDSQEVDSSIKSKIPPSFSRVPPTNSRSEGFEPLVLECSGPYLEDGFPLAFPPCQDEQHPFATHDVNEDDWSRFLNDLQDNARLSQAENNKAAALPMMLNIGFARFYMRKKMMRKMKKNKGLQASQITDLWNHHFFGPRQLEVKLMRGETRQSPRRRHRHPRGFHQATPNSAMLSGSSTSSSSSDDDLADDVEGPSTNIPLSKWEMKKGKWAKRAEYRQSLRALKREYREKRRELKAARREERREAKRERKGCGEGLGGGRRRDFGGGRGGFGSRGGGVGGRGGHGHGFESGGRGTQCRDEHSHGRKGYRLVVVPVI